METTAENSTKSTKIEKISRIIDHTLLKPDATFTQIQQLAEEARENHFYSVCVNPFYVATCSELLKSSGVLICTVVGFPLGATTSVTKAYSGH